MPSPIHVAVAELAAERPEGADEDVHFPESLVQTMLERYTKVGETVLDPFAGYGTTLSVGIRLGRRAVGVELLHDRAAVCRRRLAGQGRIFEADARNLAELGIGEVDFCLTSPPYMNAVDHPQNPLSGYRDLDGHYPSYLSELTDVCLVPGLMETIKPRRIKNGGTTEVPG